MTKALGVSQEWLIHGIGELPQISHKLTANKGNAPYQKIDDIAESNQNAPPAMLAGEARIAKIAPALRGYPEPMPKVEVRGTAQGGPSGAFVILPEEAVAYVDRPAPLNRVPNVYAVYVVGDSMEPAIHHGELRFVDPVRPPSPGDYVLIQQRNGEHGDTYAFVKKLVRRTEKKVITKQFNPEATVDFNASTVTVHRIIPWNEVHGA